MSETQGGFFKSQEQAFWIELFIFCFRSDIDVESMEMDCKKFVKDIRMLDKEMRAWDAFSGLDSTVKNMMTSLRAVGELQNPAIRERHWEQLMQATQVSPGYNYILFTCKRLETVFRLYLFSRISGTEYCVMLLPVVIIQIAKLVFE